MKELVDQTKQEMEAQKVDYESRFMKLQMEHELDLENVEARHKEQLTSLDLRFSHLQVGRD